MLHPDFRIIRAELPDDSGTLVWMVVADRSVGPTILTAPQTVDLAPYLEELLRLVGHEGADLKHLHLYVAAGDGDRRARSGLVGLGGGEHELELDEEQTDELGTLLEAIAAFFQEHDEVAQGWQVAT